SFATSSTISSSRETTFTTPLNASASVVAVGTSSAWLMLAKTPRSSRFFNKSFARTSSFSASSRIVMPSVIVTSRGGRGSGGSISAYTPAPAPVAADASAARDAVRWGATLDLRLEVVRGCLSVLMALARDFPSAMAVRARLLSLAHRYVRERRQAQQPQDGW